MFSQRHKLAVSVSEFLSNLSAKKNHTCDRRRRGMCDLSQ